MTPFRDSRTSRPEASHTHHDSPAAGAASTVASWAGAGISWALVSEEVIVRAPTS
ncbi:hypothetical protein [Rothia kristinae]|uniref:hypothetical protein n=1 Tax=Rothia kristinae TaxID=37923 RepID=UPI00244ABEFD|nr:hypothetical protein [Rothia kristinae]WGH09805.1 hypothetical protein OU799_02535 [Rothia kristinae]